MIDVESPDLVQDLKNIDSCYWACKEQIKLTGGTIFTLDGCEYIGDIMRDDSDEMAVMKGSQSRITTLFMLREIHALINNLYPQGSIYYFPKKDAVERFSKTRFGPLIVDNPVISRHLRSTDSVNIKRVGTAFLKLLGASATQILQGQKKDSMAVRSEPGDSIVRDERDLFDDVMVEMTKDRILNSTIGREVDLGTPTIPDYGIAKCFNESDQKFRLMRCPACNEYTCVTEEFPKSIKFRRGTTHEEWIPYMACIKCGKEISPRDSKFVKKYPDRHVSGYHVSHFLNPNLKLGKIMRRFEKDTIEGNLGTFYNSILGLPWIAAEDRLREQDVLNCCGNELMEVRQQLVGLAMGADIGKTDHVIIGRKRPRGRAKIVYVGRVKGFDALHDLAKRFNVKSAVGDLRPYEESFRKFQAAEPYKVYGCEYRDRMRTFDKTDDKEGVYTVARTEMFDKTHSWIINGEIELPRICEEVKEFAKQVCNCAKVLEENDRGDRIYRYRKLGDDHYRSALNYFWLAVRGISDYDSNPAQFPQQQDGSEYDVLKWGL